MSRKQHLSVVAVSVLLTSIFISAQPRRVKVGGEVKTPILIHHVHPGYPKDAKDRGVERTVGLDIVVAVDGSVIQPKVTKAVDKSLDAAAVKAVVMWRYLKTVIDGQPVEVIVPVTVSFSLEK